MSRHSQPPTDLLPPAIPHMVFTDAQETDDEVILTGQMFKADYYWWYDLDVKESDLDQLIKNFRGGVMVKLEHRDTILDPLGHVMELWRDGEWLFGKFHFPKDMASIIMSREIKKLSVGMRADPYILEECSLVMYPMVKDAALQYSQPPTPAPWGAECDVRFINRPRRDLTAANPTEKENTMPDNLELEQVKARIAELEAANSKLLAANQEMEDRQRRMIEASHQRDVEDAVTALFAAKKISPTQVPLLKDILCSPCHDQQVTFGGEVKPLSRAICELLQQSETAPITEVVQAGDGGVGMDEKTRLTLRMGEKFGLKPEQVMAGIAAGNGRKVHLRGLED